MDRQSRSRELPEDGKAYRLLVCGRCPVVFRGDDLRCTRANTGGCRRTHRANYDGRWAAGCCGRGAPASATASRDGGALLPGVEPGLWALTIRRVGLKPVSQDIRIAGGRNDYTVVATPSALTLAGVRVIGGAVYSTRLEGFERRRLAGTASAVVTHEQIEKLGPIATSRMLRGIGGLRIADSSGAIVAISTRGSKPTANTRGPGFAMVQCVMRLAVDGTIMPPLFSIDQLIPKDVPSLRRGCRACC